MTDKARTVLADRETVLELLESEQVLDVGKFNGQERAAGHVLDKEDGKNPTPS